jgi:hypothetical protein
LATAAGLGAVSVWYGKDCPRTVVGASGSSLRRKSFQTWVPVTPPNRARAALRASALSTSEPPPLPKMPPTNAAVATTSVAFQSSSVLPSAAYSPGSFSGLSRASAMYALTPAT